MAGGVMAIFSVENGGAVVMRDLFACLRPRLCSRNEQLCMFDN
jgi:hypothetical protein